MDIFKPYIPQISDSAWEKLNQWAALLREWNLKINLVSRKATDNLEAQHILPCVALAHIASFKPGMCVLDVGTGGGFPGIALAICFPETHFTLIDSIGKKIRATEAMAEALGLQNVRCEQVRAETLKTQYDFVVGRAVTALPNFLGWVHRCVRPGNKANIENGVLYLKGGDLGTELAELSIKPEKIYPLGDFFNGEHCTDKCAVHFGAQALKRFR